MDETPEETLIAFAKMTLSSCGYRTQAVSGVKSDPVVGFVGVFGDGKGARIKANPPVVNTRLEAWAICANHWVNNYTEPLDVEVSEAMHRELRNGTNGVNHGPRVALYRPPVEEVELP